MSWNLPNENDDNNATSIIGYPIIAPPISPGQILVFSALNGGEWVVSNFVVSPITGGVNSGTGSGSVFKGVSGNNLVFRTLLDTDSNIVISNNINEVDFALANTLNIVTAVNVPTLNVTTINSTLLSNPINIHASAINLWNQLGGFGNISLFNIIADTPSGNNAELSFSQSGASGNWTYSYDPVNNILTLINNGAAMGANYRITLNGGTLQLAGSLSVTGIFYDSGGFPGTMGQILTSTATGTSWQSASSADPTIYTGDGFINIGSGATRTVALASYPSPQILNIFGGLFQNNYDSITNTNGPHTISCNSDVVADSNGIFRGYALSKSRNSARINVDVLSLIGSGNNCINFYQFTAGYNMNFYADVYFVMPSDNNVQSYSWRVNTCFGTNGNSDTWQYVQPRSTSGWEQQNNNDYMLEFMSPTLNPQMLTLRIRQLTFGTTSMTPVDATLTVVCRNTDTPADGTWSIPSMTPYNDTSIIISTYEAGAPHIFNNTQWGQGAPSTMVYTLFGQRYIKFSFNLAVAATAASLTVPTVQAVIFLNGMDTGIDIIQQGTTNGETLYFNFQGEALVSSLLFQAGFMTSYAPNSQTMDIVVTSLTAMTTLDYAGYNWQISIDQYC